MIGQSTVFSSTPKHPAPLPAPLPPLDPLDPDPGSTLHAARRLAEQCRSNMPHVDHVADLALALFDQLHPHHRLDDQDRALLHAAAILHDIGHADGAKGHHKRSAQRILDADELPNNARWRLIVAASARYHRKALPSSRHQCFAQLRPDDQARVRWLAACLRLADGLDKGRTSLIRKLRCTLSPNTLLLDCFSPDIEAAAQRLHPLRKRDLLSQNLNRRVEYVVHPLAHASNP